MAILGLLPRPKPKQYYEDGTSDSCINSLLCTRDACEGLCVMTMKQLSLLQALYSASAGWPQGLYLSGSAYKWYGLVDKANVLSRSAARFQVSPFYIRKRVCSKGMLQRWFSSMLHGGVEKFCPLSRQKQSLRCALVQVILGAGCNNCAGIAGLIPG